MGRLTDNISPHLTCWFLPLKKDARWSSQLLLASSCTVQWARATRWLWLRWLAHALHCGVSDANASGWLTEVSGEYCERETFNASCSAAGDELVVITGARYGRMRRGRCVTTSPVGCHVDVERLLAGRCSARRRCDVNVASLVPDHSQPCHRDYRSYLHASYTCLKGIPPLLQQLGLHDSSNVTRFFIITKCEVDTSVAFLR